MKKQFVTYEIAKQLKELGFDEECFGYYHVNEGYTKGYAFCYSENTRTSDCSVLAPLWQQVIDFIWEKYHILINTYQISHEDIIWQVIYEFYPTKEQAILKAIELCGSKDTNIT